MAKGIVVCGLNGCGKSTLGRALAEKMGLYFIDNENLYFSRNAADEPYANPRTRAEAEALLMEEVRRHGDFVFAAVKGDYGSAILPLYRYAVLIEVPKEIRLRRVRDRSFQKFGGRMKPGGDLYESEEVFFPNSGSTPGGLCRKLGADAALPGRCGGRNAPGGGKRGTACRAASPVGPPNEK